MFSTLTCYICSMCLKLTCGMKKILDHVINTSKFDHIHFSELALDILNGESKLLKTFKFGQATKTKQNNLML